MSETRKVPWLRFPIWPWRRLCQLASLAIVIALPIAARYQNYVAARQLDKTTERWAGSAQGRLLVWADDAFRWRLPDGEGGVETRRPRKAILERSRDWYGTPWSARIAGRTITDPLAVAESTAASRGATAVLLAGLLVPLVATAVLGRVYCGWICPAGLLFDLGAKLRGVLTFLELRPGRARVTRAAKYVVLAAGLATAAWLGLPFLHAVYPPALMGREAHGWVNALFDRAEGGQLGLAAAGLSAASGFLLALVLLEVFVAPGLWCRSLCPGGALYSLLGRFRIVRVRRDASRCTPCGICNQACPRALRPMNDVTGMECDNCGVCIDVCPDRALAYLPSLTSGARRKIHA